MDLDFIEDPDWNDPVSLQACATKHKLRASQMAFENKFQLRPVQHKPFSIADQVDGDYVSDPAEAKARELAVATAEAKRQIEEALAQEKRQLEQQQQEARAAALQTPLGRLLARRF
jgi:hypothetical protein